MKKIIILGLFFLTSHVTLKAQVNWRKGGNNFTGGAQTTIGTNFQWNAPFQLMTNGNIRMHINQTNTNFQGVGTDGYIGMGANQQMYAVV
jgi:hypothetical protein